MEALAGEAAHLLFSQHGLLGLCLVISGLVNVLFYRAGEACKERRIEDARLSATALERASATNAALAAAIEARTQTLEDLARLVGVLARQTDNNDERTREKLDALLRRFERHERGDPA
jgi:hypothetical protein